MISVIIIAEKNSKKYGYVLSLNKNKISCLKKVFEGYKIIYLKIGRNQKEFIC